MARRIDDDARESALRQKPINSRPAHTYSNAVARNGDALVFENLRADLLRAR
jgi:hypothetical protein